MLIDDFQAVLCDLDGCLISGDQALPGAAAFVAHAGARLFIVSNNSTDTPETMSHRLAALGMYVPAERIVLAGFEAVAAIAETRPGARLALYGSPALRRHAEQRGLVLDEDGPDVILLTRDTAFSYAKLAEIVRHIERGAAFVVSNPDLTHPGADGIPIPETGALLEAVRACQPDTPVRTVGKPDDTLFRVALRRAGVGPENAIFIGDNPSTDGVGAARLGLRFHRVTETAGVATLLAAPGGPPTALGGMVMEPSR